MDNRLLETLNHFLVTQILKQPGKVLLPDEKLITSGMIDSFSLVDLSIFVEDTFGVHIADTELNADSFDTLTELAGLIQSRQS